MEAGQKGLLTEPFPVLVNVEGNAGGNHFDEVFSGYKDPQAVKDHVERIHVGIS